MNKVSVAGVGMYVTLITLILSWAGVTPDPATVEGAVSALITVVGFILWVWGQVKRKDLTAGLVRK